MVGVYDNAPGMKFDYDRDGSKLNRISGDTIVDFDSVAFNLNDFLISSDVFNSRGYFVVCMFPAPRRITGSIYSAFHNDDARGFISYSLNTTTGLDGTWTDIGHPTNSGNVNASMTALRNNIVELDVSNVVAMRLFINSGSTDDTFLYSWHIYGEIPLTSEVDRLVLWHPTLDQSLETVANCNYFDWGDVGRNTTSDKTFRIKNISPSLTANNTLVSFNGFRNNGQATDYTFSSVSSPTFTTTKTHATLAPGEISEVYTVRRTTASNSPQGIQHSRIFADPATWT